jgi:hypothetical protein
MDAIIGGRPLTHYSRAPSGDLAVSDLKNSRGGCPPAAKFREETDPAVVRAAHAVQPKTHRYVIT